MAPVSRQGRSLGTFADGQRVALRIASPALLVCAVLCLFWRAAFTEQTFYFGDILRLYYPERVAFLRQLREGLLPLWSPEVAGGYPLIAEGEFGPFYPPNWLLLPFSAEKAISFYVIGHYLLAAFGMYGLARLLGLDRWAASIAGLIYALGGFCIAHLNHLNILAVAAWLPVLLAASRKTRQAAEQGALATIRWSICLAAVLAMVLLAGHPQIALLAVALLLIEFAVDSVALSRARGHLLALHALALLLALGLGLALAAVQLAPTFELALLSERASLSDPSFLTSFSLHPAHLLLLVSPFILGDPYPRLSVEVVGYVGILSLLLATVAVTSIKRRETFFWGFVALCSLALSLGRWNPLYTILLRIPVLNWFRAPARFLLAFNFAMALLAASGAEAVGKRLKDVPSGGRCAWFLGLLPFLAPLMVAWGAASVEAEAGIAVWRYLPLLLAIASGWLVLGAWQRRISARAFQAGSLALLLLDLSAFGAVYGFSYNATMSAAELAAPSRTVEFLRQDEGLYRVFVHEAILPAFSVMRDSLYPNLSLRHGVQSLNAYFPLLPKDFVSFSKELTPQKLNLANVKYIIIPQLLPVDEASEFYDVEDPFAPTFVGRPLAIPQLPVAKLVVESYLSHAVHLPDGYLAAEIVLYGSDGREVRLPLRAGQETGEWAYERSDVRAEVKHRRPAVARSWPARSGFPVEDHIGYVYHAEYPLPDKMQIARLQIVPYVPSAYVRVERIVLVDPQGGQHLLAHLVGQGDHALVYRSENAAIYQNHDVLPRALLVHRTRVVGSLAEAQAALADKDFDPRQEAILEGGRQLAEHAAQESDAVDIVLYSPQRVTVHVASALPGYLVLGDAFFPGWEATVDGRPEEIVRANAFVRAVYVSPGGHLVQFRYRPRPFLWGAGVSLSALALVLGICLALGVTEWARRRTALT